MSWLSELHVALAHTVIHTDGSAHATVHLFMAVTSALADVTLDGAWVENIGVSAGATLFHTLPRAVSTNFTVGYFLIIEVGDLDNDGDLGTDPGPANWKPVGIKCQWNALPAVLPLLPVPVQHYDS